VELSFSLYLRSVLFLFLAVQGTVTRYTGGEIVLKLEN